MPIFCYFNLDLKKMYKYSNRTQLLFYICVIMILKALSDVSVSGKKVLLRVDINAPLKDGIVTDDMRLQHIIPTLRALLKQNASIILVGHVGRPDGTWSQALSLKTICTYLSKMVGQDILFCPDTVGNTAQEMASHLKPQEIMMLENIRFEAGEEKNDLTLARKLADLADIYVNDGFSVSHRVHASTEGVTRFLPSYAGLGLAAEIRALSSVLKTPQRPVAAVIGGAKISTKIKLIENLLHKTDVLVIGGGMANTFLAAKGYGIGKSLCENSYIPVAQKIMAQAEKMAKQILLPVDVVVAKEFKANAPHRTCHPADIQKDDMILDAGDQTITLLRQTFASMKTILWNGPLGAFETSPFDAGTVAAAKIVAELTQKNIVTSVAGGGDTVAALNHAGVADHFGYLSTAGGAFLEWIEGKTMPAIEALLATAEA